MKGCFSTEPAGKGIRRRSVLRLGLAGLASFAANPALAALEGVRERKLSLHNLHTGETIRTTFWADGVFQIDALRDIDFVLRDFRTGDISEIDPQLLVLLHRITQAAGVDKPFEVISGYRSPKTNAALASNSSGVAKRSLHMQGMAIDVRLPGVRLPHLRDAAKSIKAGGVGYYPKSNFIHVDTGRVRFW
ncbi:MAG: DUF882 domain-containing protein [Proteobacteria bacterium]|nr:DUF882 domain-containing protein [Pseudomonadota bacterium]